MQFPLVDAGARIDRIEGAQLIGKRPRSAGCNARRGVHGKEVRLDLVRIRARGLTGFGWSRLSKEDAESLIGRRIVDMIEPGSGIAPAFRSIEFPLLDWLGRYGAKPVYSIVAADVDANFSVPCYDTSLYFDDLDLDRQDDAVRRMQDEALEGWARGHRAFKIKVGRGNMHLPLREGTERDIAIVRGVREAVGPDAPIMIDANNGYNLNLTKEVLAATRDVGVYWLEEAFHEDALMYAHLKDWLNEQSLAVLIADGEGDASPSLLDHARRGLIDVIQYDLRGYGFCRWLELAQRLEPIGVRAAPHNYGGFYGNYAQCHIAPAIGAFQYAEWDEADVPGVDASGYTVADGRVRVPDRPGFGLELDDEYFRGVVQESGWSV